ncbi:MAG: DNA mismatch repair protein MutT [Pelagibacterales bacterium]|nr:DNA mismatch repair protein MutT [Pelagibacterales bacterium]|tara:strand:- start:644 stop:1039 length:396 start_codon:yes stop_codon:yes gene_type:complete
MKKIEVVAGIIFYKDRILCCQRKTNKYPYLSEKWEFPGGKLEEGETREKALIREIDEELEMEIKDLKFALTVVHQYEDFRLTMHTYFAYSQKPKIKLNDHKDAVWATLEEVDKFDWAAADIPIVEYIQNKL